MLLQPEKLEACVKSYKAKAPLVSMEGMIGYMETEVEFDIKSLKEFTELYESSYTYPSDRCQWYHTVKNAMIKCGGLK
jgi:hypothetical protein